MRDRPVVGKAGTVAALYIAKLVGLLLIRVGYGHCVRPVST